MPFVVSSRRRLGKPPGPAGFTAPPARATAVTGVPVVTAAVGGAGTRLFPGHVPGRVLIGMATPAGNPPPGWDEARSIIDQPIYEARRFTGSWIGANAFNSMIAEADIASALPWISFKVPGNDWAGVAAGNYNADLAALANLAAGRRTAGIGGTPKPFLCSFHHEPAGDGSLSVWADMQEFCTWYFAGRRGGTATSPYNAAHDLTDIMGWAPIGNGFWWRSMTSSTLAADRAAAWPDSLIAALNACRGVVGNDFYDTDYIDQQKALTDPAFRTPGNGVRTSTRIANYIAWARQKGVKASGAGEYGCIDGADMIATWEVMRENRDVWHIGNYFNSLNNSDHDWRLIPADYPVTNPQYVSSKGFVDFGGNAQSAGRLAAFKTTLTESVSAQYTSPL